ncbi:glycosyltransferase [Rufibacter ruber]|uniref:glycosyltransferase n=1 Tax=Rufibacter ruber TaxID=1783499 RepID=UPI000833E990|nr:glycosyltransferase [Rufibacter ruber]
MPTILFVVPYPEGKAPSQRFRFEQYFYILTEAGYTFTISSFMDSATWDILYKPGHTVKKALGTIKGFLKRFFLLFSVSKYDYVFVHREATPVGPPLFEWAVAKVFGKKIIYDFDDAIWIPNTSENNKIVAGIKWHQKAGNICRWAYKVSCGNSFLQAYAQQFNPAAFVNPTTINTLGHHNKIKEQNTSDVVIGWTGTHSTMKYLLPLIPVIEQLEQKYTFTFLIISNQEPDLKSRSVHFLPWRKETEISDLLKFNVGVMPLVDDPWAKGKCAFKALQYMALGIPAIVSPVGMNVEVVDEGINGFICDTPEQWYSALEKVILDSHLRYTLGQQARLKIEQNYAVTANRLNFLGLFK